MLRKRQAVTTLAALLFFVLSSHAQNKLLYGSTAYCHPSALRVAPRNVLETSRAVALNTTVFNTDFVSAGVGGLRNVGSGTVTLSGVTGTVTKAYLYWQGVTNSSPDVGSPIVVNGNSVSGTNIGVSDDNCWDLANSQAYRADVTSLVQATGNGTYSLSGFGSLNPNGASLIVFFDDGNTANNRDVVIFEGNDSNVEFNGISGNPNAPADPGGWNVTLNGIAYTSGTANVQLHVADGQMFDDAEITINAAQLIPAGQNFSGNTVPSANAPGNGGGLWDIRTFNVTSFLSPGPNSLNLASPPVFNDCLSLIVALIDLPAGSARPTGCTITPNCKNATVSLVNGTATLSATAIDNGSTATCGIKSLSVSPNTFSCADAGTRTVTLTVTDNNNNTSTCTATVTVLGAPPACSIASVPADNTYTGGNPNVIYLGYGPQSTTLRASPASGVTYSWSPATGLSNPTSGAPVFTPPAPGAYTFTLTTTNASGCTSRCSITICVVDVTVPGTKGKKVYVCHYPPGNPANSHTIDISINAVPSHIAPLPVGHGDKLGTCEQAQALCGSAQRVLPRMLANPQLAGHLQSDGISVTVLPNPSASDFKLLVQSKSNQAVSISITNIYGRIVYSRTNWTPNTHLSLGSGFQEGAYYAEVKQGLNTAYLKLIKTR